MKITYYGQSCFAIETKGKTILTDPFITYNELAKDIEDPVDYINQLMKGYDSAKLQTYLNYGLEDEYDDYLAYRQRVSCWIPTFR